jgi:hypothetical protein
VGESVTITFARPVHLRGIGLIPGYAKVDPETGADRFAENRRIRAVRYVFDDGTWVRQTFADQPLLQTRTVDVTTGSVTIVIVKTTGHGGRDYTAISEIRAFGAPA